MLEMFLISFVASSVTAVVMGIATTRAARHLAPRVLDLLHSHGPMTVPQITLALALPTSGRGKVVMALARLVKSTLVAESTVPAGVSRRVAASLRTYTAL